MEERDSCLAGVTLRLSVAERTAVDADTFVGVVLVVREGPKWLVDGRVEGVLAPGATAFSSR